MPKKYKIYQVLPELYPRIVQYTNGKFYDGNGEEISINTSVSNSGTQGMTGPQGPQGSGSGGGGSQGFQGHQGGNGSNGFQGESGFQGANGSQGFQGQGTDGSQGFQGVQGFQGQGIQGFQGQGIQGFQGQGTDGNQGFQGQGGVQGSQGPIGTGVQGPGSTTKNFGIVIDGGGSTITTGIKGDFISPYNMTINSWTLVCDQVGSMVVDIWKTTYAGYPPTVLNSITDSNKPTISLSTTNQSTGLTGWTTSISSGDILRFNVDSATSITRATLSINATLN